MKLKEKSYNLWLPNKTFVEVKRYAKKHDMSFAGVIRKALEILFTN